jgi:hypothetical protein
LYGSNTPQSATPEQLLLDNEIKVPRKSRKGSHKEKKNAIKNGCYVPLNQLATAPSHLHSKLHCQFNDASVHILNDRRRGAANNGTKTAWFYLLFSLVLAFLPSILFPISLRAFHTDILQRLPALNFTHFISFQTVYL